MTAWIGITTYNGTNPAGNPIVAVQTRYIDAILQAGGVPVLIPSQLDDAAREAAYKRLDGLLLTGGGDIRVDLYQGLPHPRVDGVDDLRDAIELPLVRTAAADGKPFLGICRGCQVMNVALGGTLYSHIPDQHAGALKHDYFNGEPRNYLAHSVRVEEGTLAADVLGTPLLQVNSLHHQGVKDLAPGLRASAFAPDGLIEAVELPGHPFGLAVQWHPEWLLDQEPMRHLFRSLVDAAEKAAPLR